MGGVVEGAMAVSADGSVAKPAAAAQAVAAGAASVGFQVDRDQIAEVIRDLQHALGLLHGAGQEAGGLQHIVEPGTDPYSGPAVRSMGPDLVHNYLAANKREQDKINAMIDNLEAAVRHYDAREDAAAQQLQYRKA